jgi:hypothetical protein
MVGPSSSKSSALEPAFKGLSPKDQNGIFFCLSLSAFLEHCIEHDFLPMIEAAIKRPCGGVQRRKVIAELAIAMLACCNFSDDATFADYFGCDPELLRGITVMLVLADSDDPKKVIEKPSYARSQSEARDQAIASALRILEVSDNAAAEQLSGAAFANTWNEFTTNLIPGALSGMKGMAQSSIVDATLRRIGFLSPWGKAVLQEYIKRITMNGANGRDGK